MSTQRQARESKEEGSEGLRWGEGQGQAEYALLLAGIGLAVLLALVYFGGWLGGVYQWIIAHLSL